MYRKSATIERGALRVLAALLLVDGRILGSADLALIALPWGGDRTTVWGHWIPALRRAGCQIQTVHRVGYRLLEMPPDALLEDVLTMAHQLRAEQPTRLWQLFGRDATTATRHFRIRVAA